MARAKVAAGGIIRKSIDTTWRTPQLLADAVHVYHEGIFLDVAAPPDNPMRASRFFCGPDPSAVPSSGPLFGSGAVEGNKLDGLTEPWSLPWWLNPPFTSAQLRMWLAKVVLEVDLVPEQEGLLLLPVNRTEETWVQDVFDRAQRLLLVRWPEGRGRIPFESSVDGAPCHNNPFATWILGFGAARRAADRKDMERRWAKAFGGLGRSYRVESLR